MKPLLKGASWSTIHLHVTNNLSEVQIGLSADEARRLPISTSTWFESPEEYAKVLRRCNIFLAPRAFEGIGLSFLEALSLGMAVVAPDNPTMNEYISSGENGYLYDMAKPIAPSWSDARGWGEEARRQCIEGREEWLRSVPALMDFLLTPRAHAGRRSHDRQRTRAIVRSWPGYVGYSVRKLLLALKRILFPGWKRSGRKVDLFAEGPGESNE